jgi:hypothetical protein
MKIVQVGAVAAAAFFCCVTLQAKTPEADPAVERGKAAVKMQEWVLAIKYFKEAQAQAPTDPQLLRELGRACDKAGRDLAAAGYYKAYMVAQPDAQDTGELRSRVAELEVKVADTERQMIQQSLDAVRQLRAEEAAEAYVTIVNAQLTLGDLQQAWLTALEMPGTGVIKIPPFGRVAAARVRANDLKGAVEIAVKLNSMATNEIEQNLFYDGIEDYICVTQSERGDLDEALKGAASMKSETARAYSLGGIVAASIGRGDIAGAERVCSLIKKDYCLAMAYARVAKAKAKQRHDAAGARRFIGLARETADKVTNDTAIHEVYGVIAEGLAAVGDIDAATQTVEAIKEEYYRPKAYTAIAVALAASGDSERAVASAGKISFDRQRQEAYEAVSEELCAAGKIAEAQQAAALCTQQDLRYKALSAIARKDGNDRDARIFSILSVIHEKKFQDMEDFPVFLQVLKLKEGRFYPGSLAEAAADLKNLAGRL